MGFTNEQLQRSIAQQPFGEFPPFKHGDAAGIEEYLQRVVADLTRSQRLQVEAEFNHYGSGYASYVEVFCYKMRGLSTQEINGIRRIDGIKIYLSRLTPVAVMGAGYKTRYAGGSTSDYLHGGTIGTIPPGDWKAEWNELQSKLVECYNITLVDLDEMRTPLPFKAHVPTFFGSPPYTVFDALFYWED